jgi:hypothetical protein
MENQENQAREQRANSQTLADMFFTDKGNTQEKPKGLTYCQEILYGTIFELSATTLVFSATYGLIDTAKNIITSLQ